MKTIVHTKSQEQTEVLGELIGKKLHGGEIFDLQSDLGGGKTAFVRGLARGFGSQDPVASPTFAISFVYNREDEKTLHHFDFYRLDDPGIMTHEIAEVIEDPSAVVAIEWGDIIEDILPKQRICIQLKNISDQEREITVEYPAQLAYLFDGASL